MSSLAGFVIIMSRLKMKEAYQNLITLWACPTRAGQAGLIGNTNVALKIQYALEMTVSANADSVLNIHVRRIILMNTTTTRVRAR